MNWPAFANPWMLGALAAVGLPVLIHYLTRARPRRIAFPPWRFLHEACAGRQAVHRLRTWLLLALRTLAVLALVLWFCRPALQPRRASAGPSAERRLALVVDASLSMRAVQRGVTLFARAQAEAADVLQGRSLEPGVEAAVVLIGATPRALLPALSPNLPALHRALLAAPPTYEAGDPAGALALAARLLGGAGSLYVFSDFQESNWGAVRALPPGVSCHLRPVNTEPVSNLALTGLRAVPDEPVVGEPVEILATLFNGSPAPRRETVRLELGDSAKEVTVAAPPFGTAEAVFPTAFSQVGTVVGKASVPADDLPEDNTRHLAVRVSRALQILLLSDADKDDRASAAFFVSRALAPSAEVAAGLTLLRRHSQDVDRGALETADVCVLAAPASLTGEALEIVERRVPEGARFLAFLDGTTAPFMVPAAFAPPFRLQPGAVSGEGEAISAGADSFLGEADAADLVTLRFRRHWRNEILEGRAREVLFRYPDGSAAITLSGVGRGMAAFANLPLTPDGGDFVGHPMFPVTVHELLRALRRSAEEHPVTPGTAWVLEVPAGGPGAPAVTDPAGGPVRSSVVASGRTVRLALPPGTLPGPYTVKQGDTILGVGMVNVDPREADLRPVALARLQPGPGGEVRVFQGEDELAQAGQTRPLWPLLAMAAAACLAGEMLLLAWWRRPARMGALAVEPTREPAPAKEAAG